MLSGVYLRFYMDLAMEDHGRLVEEKGKKRKAFRILTKLERKRRNTISAANP